MKRAVFFPKILLLGAVCALILPSCDDTIVGPDLRTVDPAPDVGVASTAVVYRPGDPPEVVDGAHSELVRTPYGLTVRFTTHGLEPDGMYALWATVYPAPGQCADGVVGTARCGPADAGRSVYVCGTVASTEHAAVVCRIEVDAVDFDTAEIHLTLRAHGPAPAGGIDEALDALEAETCDNDACADVQTAVHAGV